MFITSVLFFAASFFIFENQSGVLACAPKANASESFEHVIERRSSDLIEVRLLTRMKYEPENTQVVLEFFESVVKNFAEKIGKPIPSEGYKFEEVKVGGIVGVRILIEERIENCADVTEFFKEVKLHFRKDFINAIVSCPNGPDKVV